MGEWGEQGVARKKGLFCSLLQSVVDFSVIHKLFYLTADFADLNKL